MDGFDSWDNLLDDSDDVAPSKPRPRRKVANSGATPFPPMPVKPTDEQLAMCEESLRAGLECHECQYETGDVLPECEHVKAFRVVVEFAKWSIIPPF